jgi:hypothetical protein
MANHMASKFFPSLQTNRKVSVARMLACVKQKHRLGALRIEKEWRYTAGSQHLLKAHLRFTIHLGYHRELGQDNVKTFPYILCKNSQLIYRFPCSANGFSG